ncbi:MAG: N-formylglutamate amidohydrolase [Paracoccaceae bacterium]
MADDSDQILTQQDGPPFDLINGTGRGDVLLVCEHAANAVPRRLNDLGVTSDVLEAHVAWDPGAFPVARALSEALDAALFHARFSRLVYDCNRPPEATDAIPAKSELYDIPGNAGLSTKAREARATEIYRPFRAGLERVIEKRAARGQPTVLVTIHSFTPVYFGKRRDVGIGILHDADSRLADAMLEAAPRLTKLSTRRNDPYGPEHGVTHTLREHALPRGLANAMIEIRNDQITTPAEQADMAAMLARMIGAGVAALGQANGQRKKAGG